MKAAIILAVLVLGCLVSCGPSILAVCTEREAAIVAAPCGDLDADSCEDRDLAALAAVHEQCRAEAER